MYILRPAPPSPGAGIFVTGARRGGTSMVAGILRILGVDMGVGLASVNEDQDLIQTWAKRRLKPDPAATVTEARGALAKRREWPAPWGWKDPLGVLYAAEVRDLLPDPRLIIIFRDPAASVLRDPERRDGAQRLSEGLDHYQRCLALADAWNAPTALLSYERTIRDPYPTVAGLRDFCGLDSSTEQIEAAYRFVNVNAGYQDVAPFLDEVTARRQR